MSDFKRARERARQHFGGIEMGDVRRVDRLQASHRALVQQRLNQAGTYLLLEDTSELAWQGCQPREGLGPLGSNSKHDQGLHLHSVLALPWPACGVGQAAPQGTTDRGRPPVQIIGLCDQQFTIRQRRPEGEADDASCARKKRPRESQLWERATQRIGFKPQNTTVRWVRVCDRGADIYEHLDACQQARHGFVIRASQDRALVVADAGPSANALPDGGRLFTRARAAPTLGEFALQLRDRGSQTARRARLKVSAVRVALRAPQCPGRGAGSHPPLSCSVIRVWEERHKSVPRPSALRGDLHVERGGRATAEFAGASAPESGPSRAGVRLGTTGTLEPLELEVLRLQSNRVLETGQDVTLALGRLGGHLNRKGDGQPGWQVLWRGMQRLQALLEGVQLARRLQPRFA